MRNLMLAVMLTVALFGCGGPIDDTPVDAGTVGPDVGDDCFEYGELACDTRRALLLRCDYNPDLPMLTVWTELLGCPHACDPGDPMVCW